MFNFGVADSHGNYIKFGDINIGVNICEDIWMEKGPAKVQALSGAEIIVNINSGLNINFLMIFYITYKADSMRFLPELTQHILPRGSQYIRRCGLYAYGTKGKWPGICPILSRRLTDCFRR